MNQDFSEGMFKPGYYGKKRLSPSGWADINIKNWEKESRERKEKDKKTVFRHVCFSRQIGVGALEVADILSQRIGYQVIDREILEYMAQERKLTQKIIEVYDERYTGKMSELFSMLISEKTFLKSDYARQLVKTATAVAAMAPTIFVGRGIHLILPRDSVLSVRLICSRKNRVTRVEKLMKISPAEADNQLKSIDREQKKFFQSVYQKKEASNDEFDLVINRDHFSDAHQVARIVAFALEQKFGQAGQD